MDEFYMIYFFRLRFLGGGLKLINTRVAIMYFLYFIQTCLVERIDFLEVKLL